jgi:hypothetical protein
VLAGGNHRRSLVGHGDDEGLEQLQYDLIRQAGTAIER